MRQRIKNSQAHTAFLLFFPTHLTDGFGEADGFSGTAHLSADRPGLTNRLTADFPERRQGRLFGIDDGCRRRDDKRSLGLRPAAWGAERATDEAQTADDAGR